MIDVKHTIQNGKEYISNPFDKNGSLQCAYCLYVQGLEPLRNDKRMVIGLKLIDQHSDACEQK